MQNFNPIEYVKITFPRKFLAKDITYGQSGTLF